MIIALTGDPQVCAAVQALLDREGLTAYEPLQVHFEEDQVRVGERVRPLPIAYADLLRLIRDTLADDGLTDKERLLLSALRAAGPDGLSVSHLQAEVWGMHPDADSHTVETHIWRLRRKPAGRTVVTREGRYYYCEPSQHL